MYALPDQEWRINAMLLLLDTADKSGWSEGFERMQGSLLGYEEWQNDIFIETIYRPANKKRTARNVGNRLTGATDSIAGTITRVPDLLDRISSKTSPQGSISYSYDNANRRQTMQVAGQAQVSYTWDDADRLTAITQGSSAVGINYDNANRRTSLTLPDGVTVGYSADSDSRITGLTYRVGSTQLGNLAYGYDADGRVTSKSGTLAAIVLPTAVSGKTFNADNGMSAFNGTTLTYDANGNLSSGWHEHVHLGRTQPSDGHQRRHACQLHI